MRPDWLVWSNPLAVWWSFLIVVSAGNLALLLHLHSRYRRNGTPRAASAPGLEPLLLLCATYVIGLRVPLDPAARRRAAYLPV